MLEHVSWRRVSVAAAAAAVVAVTSAVTGSASPRAGADPSAVTIDSGQIVGAVTEDHRSFLGIPYAAPPVGELRWHAPEPPAPWTEPLDARTLPDACPQPDDPAQNEDCLKLNVTTPLPAGRAALPVVVWFHGGAFFRGAGGQYDPARMAVAGDVVVVTVNYRLGALGFLADDALGTTANFGLQDQIAALEWVRRNAAAFGGDPSNVTAMGGSAGGLSICAHLSNGVAPELFSRAIIQSGPCAAPFRTREQAGTESAALRAALGCDGPDAAACLRNAPADRVVRAQTGLTWSPTVGDRVVPRQPADVFAEGGIAPVDLLVGSNLDEGRFAVGMNHDGKGEPVTAEQYPRLVREQYGAVADRVLRRYPLSGFETPSIALATVQTDYTSTFPPYSVCPTLWTEQQASGKNPVYAFEFADRTAPPPEVIPGFPAGAQHASELQYLFGYSGAGAPLDPTQRALGDLMIEYWTSFARTGTPRAANGPEWPRFRSATDVLAFGDGGVRTVDLDQEHQCGFWREVAG
ncbi:para-nitrobenzyl esterase [Saccharopolyspora erythraea NRRL 2338]|uniref:Carboxylesterase, type B n=2 Tax=Saccharopolyspora erythraea TaxID=1836 RepID=A4FDP9_SACEN|nr:carboxylesterase family protein [Saccharopolyspora erythraea]EQD85703.1 para-nitrobenzyl esterase [Saccharopolyspora erythraea D]PFG95909.1 para-nitrobenzyl esterase [Saccharopolyspora erythraea NRRL 2338]QRK92479.1 carboxylesterase family protein [Saccharopolyspora erythraea]CAM02174.1 carboxylesterase, type B [Saccharopolyspora erythraea NRRL 2338]